MKFSYSLSIAALASVALVSAQQTITETAVDTAFLSTLVTALDAAGFVDMFNMTGDEYTVFAPTDMAFGKISKVTENLVKNYNKDLLQNVLKYHVVMGNFNSTELAGVTTKVNTLLEGQMITPNVADLLVEGVVNNAMLNTSYLNIEATNGIVHVVNDVLVPNDVPTQTITETAMAADALSTLVAALKQADLASMFDMASDTGFTVFAPTNDGFVTLLTALELSAEDLLASPALADVLKLHVVPGIVMSKDLVEGQMIATKNSVEKLIYSNGMISVDGGMSKAKIATADIRALNGVVHLIDTAVAPSSMYPETMTSDDNNDNSASVSNLSVMSGLLALATAFLF